jgi:hypothetical protein
MISVYSPQRRRVRKEKDVFFSFAGERPANENPQPLRGRISLNNISHATKSLSDAPWGLGIDLIFPLKKSGQ